MDLPLLDLVMDRSTKERSKMEKEMDKGYINIAMEINLKVNGKMIKSKSENMFSVQVIISKVDLNKDKCPLDWWSIWMDRLIKASSTEEKDMELELTQIKSANLFTKDIGKEINIKEIKRFEI